MRRVLLISFCLFLALPLHAFAAEPLVLQNAVFAQIVFSEIMANPLDESTGEFVELLNLGESPIDLNGWVFRDLVDAKDVVKDYTGSFDIGTSGTILTPKSYALIVDPDYAGEYNSFIEAHSDLASLLILTIDDTTLGNGLGNSSDTVTLQSSDAAMNITHAWDSDAGNGISWAGYSLGSSSETWKKSQQAEGTSVGFANNLAPEAALSKDSEEGIAPLDVTFDGSESTDPEALPLHYSFDFGDGESAEQDSPVFHHTYTQIGVYEAVLTVRDSEGSISQKNETIKVNKKVATVPCSLVISEVLPNPVGDDTTSEFIEIQNAGATSCNLAGYALDDGKDGSAPFVLGDTSLVPKEFRAFFSNTTHITLNNSGDAARILGTDGQQIAIMSYGVSKEGQSLIQKETQALWTTTPTPNADNIYTEHNDTQEIISPTNKDTLSLSSVRGAKKLEKGDDVMVEGFVIAKAGSLSSQYIYIGDSTGGIQVYNSKKLFPKMKLGQKVRVVGVISKTSQLTRILIHETDDIKVSPSIKIVAPLKKKTGRVLASDEGLLIVVTGKIEKKNGNSVVINDGTGLLTISFREGSGLKPSLVTTGKVATIQGIVSSGSGNVELLPRQSSDIVSTGMMTARFSGTLPKAGMDGQYLVGILACGSFLVFVVFQLLRARSSSTALSASTKKSGMTFGGLMDSLPASTSTSRGETLPIKRS